MNTVIAPDDFTAANGYHRHEDAALAGRNHVDRYFFRVPAGDPVLRVDLAGPDGDSGHGPGALPALPPVGPRESTRTRARRATHRRSRVAQPAAPYSRTVDGADAGVWEVTVEARRTSDVDWAPYTLTASLYGVAVAPNPDVIPNAQVGVPGAAVVHRCTTTSRRSPGGLSGSPLGSARRGVFTIANRETQDYPTTIPAGSTSFRATIGGPSDAAADLDLFVYNARRRVRDAHAEGPERRRRLRGVGHDRQPGGGHVAGRWSTASTSRRGRRRTTTSTSSPTRRFGSVSVTDANALRPTGASWTVSGSVTAGAVPEAGRVLLGAVNVVTEDGVKVGSNEVVVEHVSP